ncbi:uncharacterized protein LAESUDRAFT_666120, partial [Laetiporus sulphureus 93-53]
KVQVLKYFISCDRHPKYKICSPNLELITIIKCVCMDGGSLLLKFVYMEKEFYLQ